MSSSTGDHETQKPGSWPAGRVRVHAHQLDQHLLKVAKWHARRAIDLKDSNELTELLESATSAGASIELLAKSVLARINPSLLVDKSDLTGLLHSVGRADLAQNSASNMKSRGANECLNTISNIYRSFSWNANIDAVSLNARNAAMHMGIVDAREQDNVIANMILMVNRLLKINDDDKGRFWGEELLPIVDAIAEKKEEEISTSVQLKIFSANQRFLKIRSMLSKENGTAILEEIAKNSLHSTIDYEVRRKCPACGFDGWLICGVEYGDVRIEFDDGPPHHDFWHLVDRTADPVLFECPICELELEAEELQVVGMYDTFEIEPVEADEYQIARFNGEF